jgi:hypothetical protein
MNHVSGTAAPPRWAVAAAYAVPLCVLPSAIWRLHAAFADETDVGWYLVFLSVLSLVLALLTPGLVHGWGERVPGRVPVLGGRPIPARPVTLLAVAGGSALVAICVYFLLNQAFDLVGRGWSPSGFEDTTEHAPPGWDVLRYYAPMLAWGPLVLAVALDYRRRRRAA